MLGVMFFIRVRPTLFKKPNHNYSEIIVHGHDLGKSSYVVKKKLVRGLNRHETPYHGMHIRMLSSIE